MLKSDAPLHGRTTDAPAGWGTLSYAVANQRTDRKEAKVAKTSITPPRPLASCGRLSTRVPRDSEGHDSNSVLYTDLV